MPTEFDTCLEKGRKLFNALHQELFHGAHVDGNTATEFGERYDVEHVPESAEELSCQYGEMEPAMRNEDVGHDWIQVDCANKLSTNFAVYIIAVKESGTGIACLDIDKNRELDNTPTLGRIVSSTASNTFSGTTEQKRG